MNLQTMFQQRAPSNEIADRTTLVARYQQLRAVGRSLNNKLVERLSKEALNEGGRRLGILRKGVLVFNTEDETSVLMDYCLHDVREQGRNTIEQYLSDSPPPQDSDEMICLQAMLHSIYSVFVVESVERGVGIVVRDLRSDETLLVVDIGFSHTAKLGLVLASRLRLHDGFAVSSGASLPIGIVVEGELETVSKALLPLIAIDGHGSGAVDPAPLIRQCLEFGASKHVQYEEHVGESIGQRRMAPIDMRRTPPIENANSPVGRNDRCPCGSGKKFKHCCLKRH